MAIREVKQLVHPDGAEFVIWHPEVNVYCPVLCDEDIPPDPQWIRMQLCPESMTDIGSLAWEFTGKAYYEETGEEV
jgi:hypothetical protein